MKYMMTVAYDGTGFFGWQAQAKGRTVQGELEKALGKLFNAPTPCAGASRTDSGVHALGQRAVFSAKTTIPAEKIPLALYPYLPPDISARDAMAVSEDFNPRFMAKEKTYEYRILNSRTRNPLLRNYTEYVPEPLDLDKMRRAAAAFPGEHDFRGLCSAKTSAKTTVRTIYEMKVFKRGEEIILRVRGNAFLYNMVRIIAGTLIYAGIGKIDPDEAGEIILSGDRKRAGKTAGPRGLCLMEIKF